MDSTISQLYDSFKKILDSIENQQLPVQVIDASFITDFFLFYDEANALSYSLNAEYCNSINILKQKIIDNFKSGNLQTVLGIASSMLSLFPTIDDALATNRANDLYRYNETSKLIHHANKLRNSAIRGITPALSKPHFEGKGVFYSAIIGDYDNVKSPEYINPELDYILFTDNRTITSDVWKVIYVDKPNDLDNSRFSRIFKILGHKYLGEYDYSIWVDGSIVFTSDPIEYIKQNRGYSSILCMPHHELCCAYEEAEACLSLGKGNATEITKQIERYREESFPDHYGLISGGVIVRELHDDELNKTMETWWDELLNGCGRDQISFGYSCWKNHFLYDTANISVAQNPFFELGLHKNHKE